MGPALLARLAMLWPSLRSLSVPLLMAAVALGVVLLFPRDGGAGDRRSFPVSTPAGSEGTTLKVYIAGAVQQPGVYALNHGDRIDDLLRLAGGPAPDADLEAINLATRLRDAQQVVIPRLGDESNAGASPPSGALLNINTASKALLESLPDIGAVRAQRIIESRAQDGPFREPRDLVTRKIITERTFSKLRDRIAVQ